MTIYKFCPNVSYAFPKNSGTDVLTRHIMKKIILKINHDKHKFTLSDTLSTFSYNVREVKLI